MMSQGRNSLPTSKYGRASAAMFTDDLTHVFYQANAGNVGQFAKLKFLLNVRKRGKLMLIVPIPSLPVALR